MHIIGGKVVKAINFIIRLTERCNMNCKYCYVNPEKRKSGERMDLSIINKIYEAVGKLSPRYVEFIWHGGEPLLYDKEDFIKIIEMQKELVDKGINVGNGIQTNGTLIDDDWIKIFKEYSISVGISIDYPQSQHDQLRTYWNGAPTF